jgi:hypothetical protein
MSGFAVSHERDADWDAGLRTFFAYRDLGVAAATNGRVGAHVIRARGASDAPGERHSHALDFQLVYVLRGWVDFEYDGIGRSAARHSPRRARAQRRPRDAGDHAAGGVSNRDRVTARTGPEE